VAAARLVIASNAPLTRAFRRRGVRLKVGLHLVLAPQRRRREGPALETC
jgi:hypothetical protein